MAKAKGMKWEDLGRTLLFQQIYMEQITANQNIMNHKTSNVFDFSHKSPVSARPSGVCPCTVRGCSYQARGPGTGGQGVGAGRQMSATIGLLIFIHQLGLFYSNHWSVILL